MLPIPMRPATEFLAPESVIADVGAAPGPRSGWLFHLNAKNVVATSWEPVFEGRVGSWRAGPTGGNRESQS